VTDKSNSIPDVAPDNAATAIDDYERLDGLREAVSDFRKATYEFARGQDPSDHAAMLDAQRRIFAEARSFAAAGIQAERNTALEVAAVICDEQAEKARTSPGSARASACADRIRLLQTTQLPERQASENERS
jgi:hypothetical protein